jgi:hypothetical protein
MKQDSMDYRRIRAGQAEKPCPACFFILFYGVVIISLCCGQKAIRLSVDLTGDKISLVDSVFAKATRANNGFMIGHQKDSKDFH